MYEKGVMREGLSVTIIRINSMRNSNVKHFTLFTPRGEFDLGNSNLQTNVRRRALGEGKKKGGKEIRLPKW